MTNSILNELSCYTAFAYVFITLFNHSIITISTFDYFNGDLGKEIRGAILKDRFANSTMTMQLMTCKVLVIMHLKMVFRD